MEDILKFIENRLLEKKIQPLSYIQRLLLREILSESKRSYEEIAKENNYSASYLKQFVAPKLWSILSEALDEKINKTNCCVILELHWKKYLTDKKPEEKKKRRKFDLPTMQLPLNSNFYIERYPIEKNCYQQLLQPRALIRIKAPRQMGKSSLLARMMDYAHQQNCATVSLSLNQAETELFLNQRRFLRWLCANAAHQLGLPPKLDEYWSDDLGDLVCCTFYFAEYLLEEIDRPVVLALDEINQLFAYPNLARDFFAMLRSWYEETRDVSSWQKLRFVLCHSTEIYIPFKTNKSPFNVGMVINLPCFNQSQIHLLSKCYELILSDMEVFRLLEMTGGFPFLVQQALYYSHANEMPLRELLQNTVEVNKIYNNHLAQKLNDLEQDMSLIQGLQEVLTSVFSELDMEVAFKLKSLGLIYLDGNKAKISCELYRRFFVHYWSLSNQKDPGFVSKRF